METAQVTVLPETRHELGEGGRWLDDAFHWVDIPTGTLWRRARTGEHEIVLRIPGPLSAVARTAKGNWIAACGTGFALLDGTSIRWLHRPEPGKRMRMNDGCLDPVGRFIAGSMSTVGKSGVGSVYRLEFDGTLTTLLRGLTTPNRPVFSPDGKTMYVADSGRKRIYAYAYSPDCGRLSTAHTFVQLTSGAGSPDGMAVDADGFVWSALWGEGRICRYAPDGSLDRSLTVPAQQPTSCTFGGPQLDILYVTSAFTGLAQRTTNDGAILTISQCGARGNPATAAPEPATIT